MTDKVVDFVENEGVEVEEGFAPENNSPSQEDVARQQGWKPKEEYTGDASKWVSAETFLAKGELIDKIETLGKRLKDADKTITYLKEHHTKVKESEFKRAIDYLKSQKKQAYEDADFDAVVEIEDKISTLKTNQAAADPIPKSDNGYQAEFNSWLTNNKWYSDNEEMKTDADIFGEAYFRNNPDKSPEEVLEFVTKKIKRTYPEQFTVKKQVSSVEGGSGVRNVNTASGTNSRFQLTEEEKQVMNSFVRQGIMSQDDYISEIKRLRGQ